MKDLKKEIIEEFNNERREHSFQSMGWAEQIILSAIDRAYEVGREAERGKANNYTAVHGWLRNKYGSANRCENPLCPGDSTQYQWAKIHGMDYAKERDNFIRLCRPCHEKYDYEAKSKKVSDAKRKLKEERGYLFSPEAKENMSKARTKSHIEFKEKYGYSMPRFGQRKLTDEQRLEIREKYPNRKKGDINESLLNVWFYLIICWRLHISSLSWGTLGRISIFHYLF